MAKVLIADVYDIGELRALIYAPLNLTI